MPGVMMPELRPTDVKYIISLLVPVIRCNEPLLMTKWAVLSVLLKCTKTAVVKARKNIMTPFLIKFKFNSICKEIQTEENIMERKNQIQQLK